MTESEVRRLFLLNNRQYIQEKISKYRRGGYHPLCTEDRLRNDRYEICQKLGYGGFATVWLARDHMLHRWVSIKVMVADSTKAARELQNIRFITQRTKNKQGSQYISKLLDTFVHHGPNGAHQCLVLEFLGPTLATVLTNYDDSHRRLPYETVLRLSRQFLQAVALIHQADCGHGDLSTSNVAFSSHRLSNMTEEDLLNVTGWPITETLGRMDGKPVGKEFPRELTEAAHWEDWRDQDDGELRILDFGESFRQGAEPTAIAQPANLRVPELIFNGRIDYRSDLWHAGMMIHALIFNAYPLVAFYGDAAMVVQMIDFLGPLPSDWHPKWLELQSKAEDKVSMKSIDDARFSTRLELRLSTEVSDPQLKRFLPVIQGLLRFLPSDRISATKALELLPPPNPSKKKT